MQPASISLTTVETARTVDFGDGVFWVLALGSDARPGTEVTEGNTDAIQLIGVDPQAGRAVALGIPRDSWVQLPDGFDRINAALEQGGPELAAAAVSDLVGITPDVVLVTGFEGFTSMIGAIDGVVVDSPTAYHLEDVDLDVQRGPNELRPRAGARLRPEPGRGGRGLRPQRPPPAAPAGGAGGAAGTRRRARG